MRKCYVCGKIIEDPEEWGESGIRSFCSQICYMRHRGHLFRDMLRQAKESRFQPSNVFTKMCFDELGYLWNLYLKLGQKTF